MEFGTFIEKTPLLGIFSVEKGVHYIDLLIFIFQFKERGVYKSF